VLSPAQALCSVLYPCTIGLRCRSAGVPGRQLNSLDFYRQILASLFLIVDAEYLRQVLSVDSHLMLRTLTLLVTLPVSHCVQTPQPLSP
jgi:hypothetical protein